MATTAGRRRGRSREGGVFIRTATGFALGFAGLVALLLLADVGYLAEFLWNAPRERVAELGGEVWSAGTRGEFLLSLWTASLTTLLALVVAVPAGYALSRARIPGKVVVDTVVDAAIVLPPLIVGVSLLVLFSAIRRAAENWGAPGAPQPLLQGLYEFFVYRKPGIVLAQFVVSTALCVRAMRAAFDAADRRTEAVARTLGCTPFGAFRHAALPQAVNGMLAGGVMAWSYAIGLFAPVALFAGTIRGRTAVLPTRAYLEVSVGHLELALALTLAMAFLAMAALIAFKVVAQRAGAGGGGGDL